jgi:hypothetical protein
LEARPLSERNPRSRNHIISWEVLGLGAKKPSNPLKETKGIVAQATPTEGSSILRFASSLVTRSFYIIFRLLYGGAKFLIRGISEIRERLRS